MSLLVKRFASRVCCSNDCHWCGLAVSVNIIYDVTLGNEGVHFDETITLPYFVMIKRLFSPSVHPSFCSRLIVLFRPTNQVLPLFQIPTVPTLIQQRVRMIMERATRKSSDMRIIILWMESGRGAS